MVITDDQVIAWVKAKLMAENPEFAPGGQYEDCWEGAYFEVQRLPQVFRYRVMVVMPRAHRTIHVMVDKEDLDGDDPADV